MESYNKHIWERINIYRFCRKKDGLDEMRGIALFFM